MTDFIDCYESLETEIDKITLASDAHYLLNK